MRPRKADAIIVGAGAAGGVVAKELCAAGLHVTLLERGFLPKVEDFRNHDELAARTAGAPSARWELPERRYPREFRNPGEPGFRTIHPQDGSYAWMGGAVGGGQINYAGLMWRRPPDDFRMKTIYGHVPGTTLEDWPFTYEDLEPFYEKAEYELGVSGEAGVNPFEGRRKRPFPLPPVDLTPGDERVKAAILRLGYHPFVVPLGILTRDYRGRRACIQHPCCNGYICEVGAKSTFLSALLPAAISSGNLTLVTGAIVKEITVDPQGRPNGVLYFDNGRRLIRQSARIIVVSASATETPRLLLNSRSRQFPNGLANSSGWVGRNLMGHISPQVFGIFDDVTNPGIGPGTGIALDDFHGHIPGMTGGGVIYSRSDIMPINFIDYRPDGAPLWGREHKKFQRKNFHRYYRLTSPAEDLPQFENRVEVSPSLRDAWGIPAARITHGYHARDFELFEFLRKKMEEIIREAGAKEVFFNNPGKGRVSVHQNGTCRMGGDPKTSVVNGYAQAHDVENLFIPDSSCLVTSGGRNPALTIQAIAYRASDFIIRQWKGGAWKSI
jgi:choline dehydrogenase-like flavoprotein